jgi:hypothetical protein
MEQETQLSMQALQSAELAPIVAQVIANPHIDLLDWHVQAVSVGAGSQGAGGLGLFRLLGSATAHGQVYPWSMIVKVFSGSKSAGDPTGTNQIPSAWNYWKREILAYRSGMLAELAGNLVAPRCYGVTEHANDEWRIWLEDIQETSTSWTMARHGIAARHLGQFNGAYLTTRAVPAEQSWLYRGRAREWIAFAVPLLVGFQQYARSDSGRRWLSEQSVARIERLLAQRQMLLGLLDRLPVCLCHHDAFRRNLLARDGASAVAQTVAIDWSMVGYGGVGEDVGITIGIGLSWLEVAGDQAREMDQIIFDAYVEGLRDAGWQGDVHLARFGYTLTASLVIGVAWPIFMGALAFATDDGVRSMEATIGYQLNDILEQWATIQPFLLDLGDEALRLVDELG